MSQALAQLENYGLHWFRRDLRCTGNLALRENCLRSQQRVLAVFCFDSEFLKRSDFSFNRFAFFLQTLESLREEFRKQGGELLVVDQLPSQFFPQFFSYLKKNGLGLPKRVSWSRDYEPFAIKRDHAVEKYLTAEGIEVCTERDHLLIEPAEIKKNDSFYQIFSPFARRWFEKMHQPDVQQRISLQKKLYSQQKNSNFSLTWSSLKKMGSKNKDWPFQDSFDEFVAKNQKNVRIQIPTAGANTASAKLDSFAKKLGQYDEDRDLPFVNGTSQLSIYLKNGSLTVPQVFARLGLQSLNFSDTSSANRFAKELVWREFYYSILYHRPDVETNAFLPQFNQLAWNNNEEQFNRWQEGQTGFPIVDAGMRQLLQTGWMHNRVRMVVASFLTKDLLIDWKWGERHFMHHLLDGDLAPNNGGWQWAASTGCDPQPYFRIFNPWLQAAKFDPDAVYIKKFIPELRSFSPKEIHSGDRTAKLGAYPAPIVVHQQQKQKALALFKQTSR